MHADAARMVIFEKEKGVRVLSLSLGFHLRTYDETVRTVSATVAGPRGGASKPSLAIEITMPPTAEGVLYTSLSVFAESYLVLGDPSPSLRCLVTN